MVSTPMPSPTRPRAAPHPSPPRDPAPVGLRHALDRPEWSLPEKYQALRVLGVGGMGTVLLARDRNLGRLVAVKVIRADNCRFLDTLRREARLLSRLEHPGIVRVHELDVFEDHLYVAMEYLKGGCLSLAPLDPLAKIRALRGVVDALGHAHERGIVHRDVKPANVLLRAQPGSSRPSREDGAAQAVLTDFGLAFDARCRPDGPRPIVGTPLTMSPEQTRGEELGPSSDVFSFGVTLFREVTGEWPFRGRTALDVLHAIQNEAPRTPSRPGLLDRGLTRVLERCLAKAPEERFASTRELGDALDRYLWRRAALERLGDALPWRRRAKTKPGPTIHPEDSQ